MQTTRKQKKDEKTTKSDMLYALENLEAVAAFPVASDLDELFRFFDGFGHKGQIIAGKCNSELAESNVDLLTRCCLLLRLNLFKHRDCRLCIAAFG